MEVMTVAMLGLAAVLLAVQLKSFRPEYSTYLVFAVGILLAFYTVGRFETVVKLWNGFLDQLPLEATYVTALLKMIGIAYTVQLCAGLCKDAGYAAVGGQIEIFGKLTILSLSLPMVFALLETVQSFLYDGI